jgi:hypothetical protein
MLKISTFFLIALATLSPTYGLNIADILSLSQQNKHAFSQSVAKGLVTGFVQRLETKFNKTPKAPLLPDLPEEICVNATTVEFGIELPDAFGLHVKHELLEDLQIFGLDQITDDLSVVPIIIGGMLKVDYRLDAPQIKILGDYITSISLGFPDGGSVTNGTSNCQTTDMLLELLGGWIEFNALGKILPGTQPVRLDNLTLSVGAENFTWSADWLFTDGDGAVSYNETNDFGPYIKTVVENLWPEVVDPVMGVAKCAVNYIFGNCTLNMIIANRTSECIILDGGWLGECLTPPEMLFNFDGIGSLETGQCPPRDDPPTPEPTTPLPTVPSSTGSSALTSDPPTSTEPEDVTGGGVSFSSNTFFLALLSLFPIFH